MYMDRKHQDIAYFISFCIEQYKNAKGLTGEQAMKTMANRMQKGFTHDYDTVYGPVANDHVYTAFALYEGNIISKQALIAELRTYTLVDQYLFHTERALSSLRFIKAEEVRI